MKRSIILAIIFSCIIITSCKKNDVQTSVNVMSAVTGTSSFNSTSVTAQLAPSTALPGKTQLTITAYSGNRTIILIIPDYVAASATGTSYSINLNTASGSYNDGTFEDVFTMGTITITSNANGIIRGTFDLNTRTYVHISNGSFAVEL